MLEELKTLVAIARHGTFTAAGRQVGLTQAAVSGQMRRLEANLGLSLFNRSGRTARLSAEGLAVVERAGPLLAGIAALADPLRETDRLIRIGSIASAQPTFVTRALVAFRERYPMVRVSVTPGISIRLLDQVDAGELALAILIKPPFDLPPGLEWTSLSREPFVVLAPNSTDDSDWRTLLETMPLVRYDRTSFGGRQVERFLETCGLTVVESVEVDELPAMTAMVRNGLGVAIAPLGAAMHALPHDLRAIEIEAPSLAREIGFVRARRQFQSDADGHLAKCLAEVPPAEFAASSRF